MRRREVAAGTLIPLRSLLLMILLVIAIVINSFGLLGVAITRASKDRVVAQQSIAIHWG